MLLAKLVVGVGGVACGRFYIVVGRHRWRAGVYGGVGTNLIRIGRVVVASVVFIRGAGGADGMFIEDVERAVAGTR